MATQILNNNLTYFESLKEYGELDSMSLIAYSEILNELKSEFSERFQDIKSLNNDFQLFLNPYSINLELVKPELQIEVAELQFNNALNKIYEEKSLVDFYASLDSTDFPKLRKFALGIVSIFGSTYLCEQLFSMMKINKNAYRNRISHDNLKSQLRLISSSFKPNISSLSQSK